MHRTTGQPANDYLRFTDKYLSFDLLSLEIILISVVVGLRCRRALFIQRILCNHHSQLALFEFGIVVGDVRVFVLCGRVGSVANERLD